MKSMMLVLSLSVAITLAGCRTEEPRPLNARKAAALAARLANTRYKKLNGTTPFRASNGVAVFRDNRWVWGAELTANGQPAIARVTFNVDGTSPKVDVSYVDDSERPIF